MPDDLYPADLAQQYQSLMEREPSLRLRDAASRLATSEMQLVALGCARGTTKRLAGDWGQFLHRLADLGTVMALTRNEHCVHEKIGHYDKISVEGQMGLVLDPDIDLRVFLSQWHTGFAVTEESPIGPRHSLQIFNAQGVAVHKVYLKPESDRAAFDALVADYMAPDQSAHQTASPAAAAKEMTPDEQIDVPGFRAAWSAMQDTHEFFGMLRRFGVAREQGLRLAEDQYAWQLQADAPRPLLEKAAATGLPIMVFVGSPGVIQIHTGPVERIVETGPWINVLDPGFNLHLRADRVARAWAVRKPTADGIVTAVELFDEQGEVIAMIFGKRKPGEAELEDWRALVADLPRA